MSVHVLDSSNICVIYKISKIPLCSGKGLFKEAKLSSDLIWIYYFGGPNTPSLEPRVVWIRNLIFQCWLVLKRLVHTRNWFHCLSSNFTEALRGSSLLFNTNFPDIPGTHLMNLGRMKDWVNLGATQWFWIWYLWNGNPAPKHMTKPLIFIKKWQIGTDGKTNKNKNQHCF